MESSVCWVSSITSSQGGVGEKGSSWAGEGKSGPGRRLRVVGTKLDLLDVGQPLGKPVHDKGDEDGGQWRQRT